MKYNKLFVFALLSLFSVEILAATADDIKTVDSKKEAFTRAQFDSAFTECFTTFKTYFDSLAAGGTKTAIATEVGNYYLCAKGALTYFSDGNGLERDATKYPVTDAPVGLCKYVQNSVDGSEQLRLHSAIQRCYSPTEDNDGITSRGQCRLNANAVDQGLEGNQDGQIGGKTDFKVLQTCIENAIFYALPYTERQFKNCQAQCAKDNAGTDLSTEAAYLKCVRESSNCGKLKILAKDDATNSLYATLYKKCYTDECNKKITGTTNNAYTTCIDTKCTLPDYSYKVATGGNIITASLVFLLGFIVLSIL